MPHPHQHAGLFRERLTAAFGMGYSLATIRYLTRAYVWSVTSPTGEEVQFVLEDDDE